MAAVGAVKRRVSYADLERWPEDGRRYELYDGEVRVVPSPLPVHQLVAMNLVDIFRTCGHTHGGLVLVSPIDIIFSDYDVIQPDVVFFEASRRHLVHLDAPIRHHPDIAVEVLSPSTRAIDRGRKMEMLAGYGVPEYWIVDPDAETIELYVLRGDGYALAQRAAGTDKVESAAACGLAFGAGSVFPTDG